MEHSFQITYLCTVNKRDDILKAALKLFVEQGEQSTSMKWIAKEAKCGIGTMYNYFPSKNELINELYVEVKTKLANYIFKTFDPSVPVKQQFIDTWLKLIEYGFLNPFEYKFMAIFAHTSKISEGSNEIVNKLLSPFLGIYEKGKREGIIKNLDTQQLLIFTNGAITTSIINQPNINEQDKRSIVLMAWDAIKS